MKTKFFKTTCAALILSLFLQQACLPVGRQAYAQTVSTLNLSNFISTFSKPASLDKFRPVHLRYLSYNPSSNDFKLLLDKGDELLTTDSQSSAISQKEYLKSQTKKLMDYFLTGVILPNETFWVNLRPDSPDNIIDSDLAKTDLGKVLLEADLELKKDTANLTNPKTAEGKIYWSKLYKKAEELFGLDNVTIPTLTRPWIVPGEIVIRESKSDAYIYKATLKVMLESDYLKGTKAISATDYSFKDPRLKALNDYSSELIKELIIPILTKQINTSKKYAPLRQAYYSIILAQWFKSKFKNQRTAYSQLIDSKCLRGDLLSKIPWQKETYFKAYQDSFNKGEYNIKEPISTMMGQSVRSYVSGGVAIMDTLAIRQPIDSAQPTTLTGDYLSPEINLTGSGELTIGSDMASMAQEMFNVETGQIKSSSGVEFYFKKYDPSTDAALPRAKESDKILTEVYKDSEIYLIISYSSQLRERVEGYIAVREVGSYLKIDRIQSFGGYQRVGPALMKGAIDLSIQKGLEGRISVCLAGDGRKFAEKIKMRSPGGSLWDGGEAYFTQGLARNFLEEYQRRQLEGRALAVNTVVVHNIPAINPARTRLTLDDGFDEAVLARNIDSVGAALDIDVQEPKDIGGPAATSLTANGAIVTALIEERVVKLRFDASGNPTFYRPNFINNYTQLLTDDPGLDDTGEIITRVLPFSTAQLVLLKKYLKQNGLDPAKVTIGIIEEAALVNHSEDDAFTIVHAGTRTSTIWFGEYLLRSILSEDAAENIDNQAIFRHDALHITDNQRAMEEHRSADYLALVSRLRDRVKVLENARRQDSESRAKYDHILSQVTASETISAILSEPQGALIQNWELNFLLSILNSQNLLGQILSSDIEEGDRVAVFQIPGIANVGGRFGLKELNDKLSYQLVNRFIGIQRKILVQLMEKEGLIGKGSNSRMLYSTFKEGVFLLKGTESSREELIKLTKVKREFEFLISAILRGNQQVWSTHKDILKHVFANEKKFQQTIAIFRESFIEKGVLATLLDYQDRLIDVNIGVAKVEGSTEDARLAADINAHQAIVTSLLDSVYSQENYEEAIHSISRFRANPEFAKIFEVRDGYKILKPEISDLLRRRALWADLAASQKEFFNNDQDFYNKAQWYWDRLRVQDYIKRWETDFVAATKRAKSLIELRKKIAEYNTRGVTGVIVDAELLELFASARTFLDTDARLPITTSAFAFHARAPPLRNPAYINIDVRGMGIMNYVEFEIETQQIEQAIDQGDWQRVYQIWQQAADKVTINLRKIVEVLQNVLGPDALILMGGDEITVAVDGMSLTPEVLFKIRREARNMTGGQTDIRICATNAITKFRGGFAFRPTVRHLAHAQALLSLDTGIAMLKQEEASGSFDTVAVQDDAGEWKIHGQESAGQTGSIGNGDLAVIQNDSGDTRAVTAVDLSRPVESYTQEDLFSLGSELDDLRREILSILQSQYNYDWQNELDLYIPLSPGGVPDILIAKSKEEIRKRNPSADFSLIKSLETRLEEGKTALARIYNSLKRSPVVLRREAQKREGMIQEIKRRLALSGQQAVNIYVSEVRESGVMGKALFIAHGLINTSDNITVNIFVLDPSATLTIASTDRIFVQKISKIDLLKQQLHKKSKVHVGISTTLDFIDAGEIIFSDVNPMPNLQGRKDYGVSRSGNNSTNNDLEDPFSVLYLDRGLGDARKTRDGLEVGEIAELRRKWLETQNVTQQLDVLSKPEGWDPSLAIWSWGYFQDTDMFLKELDILCKAFKDPAVLEKIPFIQGPKGKQLIIHLIPGGWHRSAYNYDWLPRELANRGIAVVTEKGQVVSPSLGRLPITVVLYDRIELSQLQSKLSGTLKRDKNSEFYIDFPAFVTGTASWLEAVSCGSIFIHDDLDVIKHQKRNILVSALIRVLALEDKTGELTWEELRSIAEKQVDRYLMGADADPQKFADLESWTRQARAYSAQWFKFNMVDDILAAVVQQTRLPEGPATGNGTGGIDFRSLPVTTQPMPGTASFKLTSAQIGQLNKINISEELRQIKNMVKAGIMPSGERIRETLLASCQKRELDNNFENIISCIAAVLRLEEESSSQTDITIKESLIMLESGSSSDKIIQKLVNLKAVPIEVKNQNN